MGKVRAALRDAFRLASSLNIETHRQWINISFRVGHHLPKSLLSVAVQRAGEIDLLVRCLEAELASDLLQTESDAFHHQFMLSEIWIGLEYEVVRLFKERRFSPEPSGLDALAHDLRLLRVSIEKHMIAADRSLTLPLMFDSPDGGRAYLYDKADNLRSHIMPTRISGIGVVEWQVVDLIRNETRWINRRELSDRFLDLWTKPAAL